MKEKLEQIRREALAALSETKTAQDLDALRVKYLGKKGALTAVLKQMGGLSAEERPIIGQLANEVREALTTALEQEQKRIEKAALDARLELEQVDVTIPGKPVELGPGWGLVGSARACRSWGNRMSLVGVRGAQLSPATWPLHVQFLEPRTLFVMPMYED